MNLLHDGCRIDDDCDVVVNNGVRKVDDELYCDADDVGTKNDCDNCVDDNDASNDYIIPLFVNGIQTSGLRDTGFGGAIYGLGYTGNTRSNDPRSISKISKSV